MRYIGAGRHMKTSRDTCKRFVFERQPAQLRTINYRPLRLQFCTKKCWSTARKIIFQRIRAIFADIIVIYVWSSFEGRPWGVAIPRWTWFGIQWPVVLLCSITWQLNATRCHITSRQWQRYVPLQIDTVPSIRPTRCPSQPTRHTLVIVEAHTAKMYTVTHLRRVLHFFSLVLTSHSRDFSLSV